MNSGSTTRRLAALFLLFVALVTLASIAILPYVGLRQVNAEIEEKSALTKKLLRMHGEKTRSTAESENEEPDLEEAGSLLSGDTTGIAGAELQKWVNAIVNDHRGTPIRYQVLEPEEDGKLTRVGLNASLRTDIEGLRDIVHQIETGIPILFIDSLTVQPSDREDQIDDPYFIGPLDVNMHVIGYMQSKRGGE